MMQGVGPRAPDALTAIRAAYERGESDEFMKPVVIERNGEPVATVRDGDAIILFNFRADRMRQITRALTEEPFDGFDVRGRPSIKVVTMTQYDETYDLPVVFPPFTLARVVAEVISAHGGTQFRTRGNGEVRARHVLLQRGRRGAVQGRGARARAEPEGRDVRSGAGDERVRGDGRVVQGDQRRATTISFCATTRTATWWDTPA